MSEGRKGFDLGGLDEFKPREGGKRKIIRGGAERPQETREEARGQDYPEAQPAEPEPKQEPRRGRPGRPPRAKGWKSRESHRDVQVNIRADEEVVERFRYLAFMERLSYGEALRMLLDMYDAENPERDA